jgi:hypothetical protein
LEQGGDKYLINYSAKRRGRRPGGKNKPKEQAAARPAPPIVLSYGLWTRLGGRIEELRKDFG